MHNTFESINCHHGKIYFSVIRWYNDTKSDKLLNVISITILLKVSLVIMIRWYEVEIAT